VVLKVCVLIALVGLGAAYIKLEHLTPLVPPNGEPATSAGAA
jgi:hypothetical protein